MPRSRTFLRSRWLLPLLLIALLVPALPAQLVAAATINVNGTTGSDTATCGSAGSPCKTIGQALNRAAPSGDTIAVSAGTYKESMVTGATVSIVGAGEGATFIDGDGKQALGIISAGKIALAKLTVQNGVATRGGGISNNGTLTLDHVTIRNNTATGDFEGGGGIYNTGTLTGTDVTITGNKTTPPFDGGGPGGGLETNGGKVDLSRCVISGNTTVRTNGSGASADKGSLSLSNCQIRDNPGTALSAFTPSPVTLAMSTISGSQTGVSLIGASLTLTSSTISNNSGDGILNYGNLTATNSTISGNGKNGLEMDADTATLVNVTLANNGVGILSNGPLTLQNTLLANTGANCKAPITSQGHNASSDTSCGFTQPTDLSGAALNLAGLANNGGPTQTHALLPGSAALDKGGDAGNGCPAADQRGVKRPQGAACDIGAFELEVAAPTTAPKPATLPLPTTPPTTPPITTAPSTGPAFACTPLAPNSPFASSGFQSQWQAGEAVAPNFWGPTVTVGLQEEYADAPGGLRVVQYFDKGRMELTNPASGTVTNGLLANELISGRVQVGDGSFRGKEAANLPIAGDADNPGPTYAALGTTAAGLLAATPAQTGTAVTTVVAANGSIAPGSGGAGSGPTTLSVYDGATEHNVPQAFAQYRDKVGLLTIGYAKSEPFMATVKVAGVQRLVMVQVFERRVLTYTAENPDAFKVEMGNIGQHYYHWRYCIP